MTKALHGITVLIPENRELELFAAMLETEGATAWRCPLVNILDLEDSTETAIWIEQLVAGMFQDVIWLTGEGLRQLLALADRSGIRPAFVAALRQVRNITRGPKPVRVLRELGLKSGLPAVNPTSQGVLDALAAENLTRRAIGVQLYPDAYPSLLVDSLRARGANIFPVTPYRYATAAQTDDVLSAIQGLINGRIDIVAFTASPQVERFVAVARVFGLEGQLRDALMRVQIAAVGPVVEETLRCHGLTVTLHPAESFHLKPLVRAIVAARQV